ncbi:MAG: hypothetical protein KIT35_21810 [Piscinibacter sp.]|uniref:hypothetical protein n=1 Tax=Piscinibacter sp. TaxID=1903157 RepID=UPI00258DD21E|nr:hypothetical protein [Piscinibacter sp.]MCW5666476.1 hypothetical protein [Piscinibacter sp.]
MGIPLKITHDGQPGARPATVSVVTVGQIDGQDQKKVLSPGDTVTLTLQRGQFALIDETDEKEGT